MTTSKGKSTGKPAGKSGTRSPKNVSQVERPFSAGDRGESHRLTARAATGKSAARSAGKSAGKSAARSPGKAAGRSRAKVGLPASPPRQSKLPFDAAPAWLRARMRPERFSRRMVQLGVALLALLLAGALLMIIYSLSHGLRLFELREVVVHREQSGSPLIPQSELEKMVRSMVKEGVLRADLERVRTELRKHEYIEEVEVRRLLPDMLRISVRERVPFALARRSDGTVQCVDLGGTLFGSPSLLRVSPFPPQIMGLRESGEDAATYNQKRLRIYQELMTDLDRIDPPLSREIDEIYFDELEGVRVLLADTQTFVYLAGTDFRTRLNSVLDILDAVRRKDLEMLKLYRLSDVDRLMSGRKIRYLNATNANRITIGYDEL